MEVLGVVGIVVLLLLILLRLPIAFAMLLVGFLGVVIIKDLPTAFAILGTTPYAWTASYSLSVFPLFVLIGSLAFSAGLGKAAYDGAYKFLNKVPGGLAMATTAACALFGAVCGSTAATAATFTRLALPDMLRYKYNPRFATGCIACAGGLAAMIPPSIAMVIYCTFTETSLAKLMIAGFVPGGISTLLIMALIYVMVRLNPSLAPRGKEDVPMREKIRGLIGVTPIAAVIMVIFGGIYTGIFTPTEAASIGCIPVLIGGILRGGIGIKSLMACVKDAAVTTGMVFFIVIGAMVFARFIALSRFNFALVGWIAGLNMSPNMVAIMFVLMYVVLGMFLDTIAMLSLTLPIIFPVMRAVGFDPIWFGILVVLMVEIGVITPPVGMNVYVMKGVAPPGIEVWDIFMGAIPFIIAQVAMVAIMMVFPQIVLWLPELMMGK